MTGNRLGQILGLDGLRALSVLMVMLYHAHVPWMIGGYLGVEIFFVISGFLITSLLLQERDDTGTILLGAFWLRRFRRLLPALISTLIFVAIVGAYFLGKEAAQFRGDLVASLLYMENWYQIYLGNSYFADQGYPLLRHIWSLAIEEQYYLLWPLLVSGLLSLGSGRRILLASITIVMALGSMLLMFEVAQPFLPSAIDAANSMNRAYLGTDTRASGLLLGSLFALVPRGEIKPWALRILDLSSLLSLLGLIFLASQLEIQGTFLYRGGFILVDVLTLGVILGLIQGNTLIKQLLDVKILKWIGLRSYGIYLWHWPIFRLLEFQGLTAWMLTFIVAQLSYQFIEMPIRSGSFDVRLHSFASRVWGRTSVVILGILGIVITHASYRLMGFPPYVNEIELAISANALVLDNYNPSNQNQQLEIASAASLEETEDTMTSIDSLPDIPRGPLVGVRVTAIGDSVMKGASLELAKLGKDYLGKDNLVINAEESRSFGRGSEIISAYRSAGRLGDVVIVHLGANNKQINPAEFKQFSDQLVDRRLVLYVNARSNKMEAYSKVNSELSLLIQQTTNGKLLDWASITETRSDLFIKDQTHLRPQGARFYSATIFATVSHYLQVQDDLNHESMKKYDH